MNSRERSHQCRLCLKFSHTRINVFVGEFPKMLEILTSIKVRENDGLPKYACSKCAQDVKMALSVKSRIIKSYKTLKNALENEKKLLRKISTKDTVIIVNDDDIANEQISKIISDMPAKPKMAPPKSNEDSTMIKSELQEIIIKEEISMEKDESPDIKTEIEETAHDKGSSKQRGNVKTKLDIYSKKKCEICGRLITITNMNRHVKLHTAGPTECKLCGATCKNFESLRGHMFYQHKNSAEQYVCETCGKGFRMKYKLLLHHKKVHGGARTFKCETCGKSFFTKGNLLSHVRMTHEKLRPHVCEFCGTGFSSPYALKTHRRQHTNEKPYVCEICQEGFRQRVSLRTHLKSKHGVEESKEFVCETCCKGFATSYALNIHERLHMVEKCKFCSETFAGEHMKIHLKEVHEVCSDKSENQ